MNFTIPHHVPLAVTTRGGMPELIHIGSVAVVDAEGRLIAGLGDAASLNFTRSALKPLQVLPFVSDGGMDRFGFSSQELALMCASHNGEAVHVGTVRRILDRAGVPESDLQCGCHPPSFFRHTGTAEPAGARWTAVFHNCSGKHSGFLSWCRMHGQPAASYLDPDSPLQARIRAVVRGYSGDAPLPMGIDGCSAPNYALPLSGLARAFCHLAIGKTPEMAAAAYAMTRHPDLVSGTARSDLALMVAGGGNLVTKTGADGVHAIGVRDRGIGIAVRVADGNVRAVMAVVVEVLQQLGVLGETRGTLLERFTRPALTNYRGLTVGATVPVFTLPRVGA